MFKCTVCQKLHKEKTDYCDCGNDEFTEAPSMAGYGASVTPKQLLSWGIFAICIALSGWIWFGFSPQQKSVQQPSPQPENVKTIRNIPSIDKIWDDTLPDTAGSKDNPLSVYKLKLQNTLYGNIETRDVIDNGRCKIEFKVNKNGKLTNRRLIKEEGGTLFNNEVIRMMKNTAKVDIPPTGFAGVKFTADVFTENGVIKIKLR